MVLEKTLESPLVCKGIQPVNSKGNQSWIFVERIDTEAEAPILLPPDGEGQLIGKDPDAWKDWGQEEKGVTEDKKVGWHHQLNRHAFVFVQLLSRVLLFVIPWTTVHQASLPFSQNLLKLISIGRD